LGEALALDGAWLFAAFLILLVLAASGIAVRRFLLERRGARVECGLRRPGGSWRLGLASYQLDEFYWYRVFGFSMRPEQVLPRRDLAVVARRPPTEEEVTILGPGRIVAECQLGPSGVSSSSSGVDVAGTVDLAMAESALTGLLVWLEAAPPGSHLDVALLPTVAGRGPRQAQPRSPPGFHSTSPCPVLATRDKMNSRSDSRFR
jgi:hypothetical protein